MVNEAEVRDTPGGAGAAQALGPAFAADPLSGSRSAKRWTRIGVYLAILGYGPLYLFVFGYELRQVFISWTVGLIIATVAIELAFGQVFKLRKRGAYPGVLLAELGSGHHLNSAVQHCLGVIQRLMATRAAFLALCNGDDEFDLISVSGMGREAAERLLQAGVREVREAMRSQKPVPFKLPGGWSAEGEVSRKDRLVFIPVSALQQPIGVVAVAGQRRNPDLKDDQLLSSVGVALGLSLESLRQGKEIRESEERLHTVISSTPIVMFALDREGTFMLAEGSGLDTLGFHRSHVLGRSVFEQCRHLPQVLENVRRALAGEAFTTTLEVNGRALEAWLSPVRDGSDELSGITGVVTDITERVRAEEALRETEQRLHTVVGSTPIILFALDREGVFTLSEGKGLEALGLKPGQVVGQSVFDVYRDLPEIEDKFRRALAGEPLTGTVEVGGLAFETLYSPLRDENGQVSGVIGVATDVTERKRAEVALQESEEKLRSVIDNVPDLVTTITPDGTFVFVNRAVPGVGVEEVIGTSVYDYVPPEDREIMRKAFERAAETGEPGSYESRGIGPDGTTSWYSCRVGPIKRDDEVVALTLVATDITERKRADEALRESEGKFRTLAETISAAAFIFQGTRLRYVNSASEELTGYSREELLTMNFWDVIHPDFQEKVKARGLARQRGEPVPTRYEAKLLTKNGDERWVDFTVGVVDFEGSPAVMGTGFDITERKRADDALRRSEERYRLLADNATDMIWTRDLSLRPTYTSPSVTRLRGHTVEEAMAQTLDEVLTPDSLQLARRTLAEELGKESAEDKDLTRTRTLELEMYRKDGSTIWTEMTVNFLRDEENRPTGLLGVTRDISERKRTEQALQESETKFRTLAETVAAAAFIYQGSRIRYVNSAAEALTGYTREEMLEMNFWDVIAPDFRELARERGLARQKGQDVPLRYEVKLVAKNGDERWVDFTAGKVEFEGSPAVLGTAFDITERKQAEETIKHLAYHDALTDLPNRTLFKDRLTQAVAQARRKRRMVAVLFLDLDHFKVVNDTVGHGEGDKLLGRVSERLTGLVREADTVARVGGDEFALLSSEITHAEDAAEVAERVLKDLRRPWVLQGQEFLVSASVGIAVYPGDGDDAETLLRNADTAMYRAKEHGRDNFRLYTPAMNARIVERLALESSLRRGLELGEFMVYYQPQVNIRTGQVVGAEALVRWQHPERGLVLPAEFIPVAEETGLIVPLGEWVLRTACAQNKAWQEAGLPLMRVAVNLSARQFQQRSLTDTVAQVLQETGLDARWLQLEITEGIAMQDADFTNAMLRGLREMGVQIAIDDFGTGYSSLAYLKRFPIDAVKIDRSFVRDLTVDPNDAAIATTVITMAHSLKLSVIAEGVETEEQLAFLKQRQCDEMQGFLFSKPVPVDVLEKTLRTNGRRARARTAVDST